MTFFTALFFFFLSIYHVENLGLLFCSNFGNSFFNVVSLIHRIMILHDYYRGRGRNGLLKKDMLLFLGLKRKSRVPVAIKLRKIK